MLRSYTRQEKFIIFGSFGTQFVYSKKRQHQTSSAYYSIETTKTVRNRTDDNGEMFWIDCISLYRNIFDKIKLRITKLDHNLYDVIWPSVKKLPSEPSLRLALESDFPLGIVAPDFYVYKVFKEFFDPVLKEYNCMDLRRKFSHHPPTKFLQDGAETCIDLDQAGSFIMIG